MSTENQTKDSIKSPKGWIRWSGLGVFLAVIAGIVALGYFSFTLVLKNQLEHYASQAWGAKIEIGSLDLGLMPLELGVQNLQITDPDKPMENILVIKRIGASLNFYHLVVGRTVVEDVFFNDLALHQPRKTSGALPKKVKKKETGKAENKATSKGIDLPNMALPNPDEILKRESLQTVETANAIERQLKDVDQAWAKLQDNLPDDKALKAYQKRLSELTQGEVSDYKNFAAKKEAFEQLKSELETKKQSIEKASDLLKTQLPKIQQQVVALKSMPSKDFNRLMDKYAMNQTGLSNVTYLLFGPQIQSWTNTGLKWYRKAEPFIAKLKEMQAERAAEEAKEKALAPVRALGTDVAFKEYDPQPDFIVKRVNVSGDMQWGRIEGKASQVTFDHPSSRLPILFNIKAMPKGQTTALTINGQSNFVKPDAPINQADFSWQAYQVKQWDILKDDTLPVTMNQAVVDVAGNVSLVGLDKVDALINLNYQKVAMTVSGSKSKEVKRYIAPIFKEVNQFNVKADIEGSVTAPNIGAKSNLDQLLSKAFNKALNKEVAQVKTQLRQELNARLEQELGPINQQLKGLLGEQLALEKDSQNIEKMLSAKLEDQVKKEAEKAVGQELKKLFKF
ncbi:TIGR03545 family protein [Hydrogenovibrio sp. 3SP14C1]|uniref:TIGR03545 family protein n=1 Tax=Hydrogenovibrio sp. 3SP14C1 TaxID=3038774 RepID=UPI00241656CF|nr:TIGR03545 family protein [Hydrogenovibrio sp. 3SP14C1]MDG4811412.1 TIGR03545 family protein [Hydrogenovibrio sp. 3SP14C1]